MEQINPQMLALAREMRGLTQLELSKKVGVDQSNFSKIEKGLLQSSLDLLKLIGSALDFPQSFFYKKNSLQNFSPFYYRKRVTLSTKDLCKIEAQFKVLALCVDELLSSVDIPDFNIPPVTVKPDNSPSEIARKVRSFLQISPGPINNIVKTLEASGIMVYFLKETPEKFDGMTMITTKSKPIIFINSNMPNDRKRHTLAHELAHIVMHIRNLNDFNKDNATLDKEADEFASEFLMPLLECRYELEKLRMSQLGVLKSYWKVSKSSIIVKAFNNRFIDDKKYKTYLIELSRNGERKVEHGFVEIDKPVLIEKMVNAHLDQLHYTKESLMQILSLNEVDFDFFFMNDEGRLRIPKLTIVI
jgi:Zn-dependent peptidase ImmA (M78 family)/DNA-binding XRE family transcriptional regulator